MKKILLGLTFAFYQLAFSQAPIPTYSSSCDQNEVSNNNWTFPSSGKSYVEDIFYRANSAMALGSNHNGMAVNIANHPNLKTEGTIQFYFKYSGTKTGFTSNSTIYYPYVFIKNQNTNSGNIDDLSFGITNSNKFYVKTGPYFITSTNADIDWQKWSLFTITYKFGTGGYINVYKDSKLILNRPLNNTISSTAQSRIYFASHTTNNTNFVPSVYGDIDDIRVYSYLFSEPEVYQYFRERYPVVRGNQALMYKFENNLEDAIGNRDGIAVGDVSYVQNHMNQPYSAVAINNHDNPATSSIKVPTSINDKLGQKYSISFGFNLQSSVNQNNSNFIKPIVSLPTGTSNPINIGLRNGFTEYPVSVMNYQGFGQFANENTVTLNQWAYTTIVFNQDQMTIYVNGRRVVNNYGIYNFDRNISSTESILIGKSELPLEWFRGYLDDLIIDNRVYTAQDAVGQYYQWLYNFENTTVDTTLAAENSNTQNAKTIKVFPNPATDFISVEGDEVSLVTIYSAAGQAVTKSKNAKNIDIRSLQKGNYFISAEFKDGTLQAKTFIKK